MPQTGWFRKPWRVIFAELWRLEVQDKDAGRVDAPRSPPRVVDGYVFVASLCVLFIHEHTSMASLCILYSREIGSVPISIPCFHEIILLRFPPINIVTFWLYCRLFLRCWGLWLQTQMGVGKIQLIKTILSLSFYVKFYHCKNNLLGSF